MLPFPMGRLGLPESADDGDVVVSKGKARFEFRHVDGGRHLIVDYPAFDGGTRSSCRLVPGESCR